MLGRSAWRVIGFTCCAALLLVLGVIGYDRLFQLRVEPVELIRESAAKAGKAGSYRYDLVARFQLAGKDQHWIRVAGERSGSDAHFKGRILGTPVEIYQTGTRNYTLDPVSGNWVILDGVDLGQQQLYMAEIDPLSNFRFKGIGAPRILGREMVNGRKCWVVEFQPRVESKYLEMWWKNFTYRFWVEARGRNLLKAMATAENKNSPGTFLTLTVEFRDYNRRIEIRPPVQ